MPVTIRTIANIGSPPDDPLLNLYANLYIPDPSFAQPYHCMAGTRSGGFTDGGLSNLDGPFQQLAGLGILCLAFACRLALENGGGGLPGQTTDGKWHQQTDDCKSAVRYMRPGGLIETLQGFNVTGFVGTLGGSGSGHHAIYMACDGTQGDDKSDAAIGMSPSVDFSDRDPDVLARQPFIDKVVNYGRTTDLPTLLARSPISLDLANANHVHHTNGDNENMPLSQLTRFSAAMAAAGNSKYESYVLTGSAGTHHAFGEWPYIADEATTWLLARMSEFGGGGPPPPPPPTGGYIVVRR